MVRRKIYTRTGDKGETSLFTGQRVLKNDPFIQALGAIDECNSLIGLALSFLPQKPGLEKTREQLEHIQHVLFDLGAAVATPRTRAEQSKIEQTRFDQHAINLLEEWMDAMDETLPPLNQFILPGGHSAGAALHTARSVCRRTEQHIAPLYEHLDVSEHSMRYLNRLSDYLFIASRFINHQTDTTEMQWQKHKGITES